MTGDNRKVLEIYKKIWSEIKKLIKAINGGECNSIKSIKYKKDPVKIRLDSYDDLPLDKILCYCFKYNYRICFSN